MSVQRTPKLFRDSICKWLNENESQIISASLSFAPSPALFFKTDLFLVITKSDSEEVMASFCLRGI